MAIIKEDGTGLTGASVYADVADLDALATLRGVDVSGYSTAQKEVALYLVAQDYIDGQNTFDGIKVNEAQGMDAYTSVVTFALASADFVKANCIGALFQLQGVFFVNETAESAKGAIKAESSKLDALEDKVEYFENSGEGRVVINTGQIDDILLKYTSKGFGGGVSAMRY